jgi:hypothetical protein
MDAPAPVDPAQLDEIGLQLKPRPAPALKG